MRAERQPEEEPVDRQQDQEQPIARECDEAAQEQQDPSGEEGSEDRSTFHESLLRRATVAALQRNRCTERGPEPAPSLTLPRRWRPAVAARSTDEAGAGA